jgi:hypothetical protein
MLRSQETVMETKADVNVLKQTKTFIDDYERGRIATSFASDVKSAATSLSFPLGTFSDLGSGSALIVLPRLQLIVLPRLQLIVLPRLQLAAHVAALAIFPFIDTHRLYARALLLPCAVDSELYKWKQEALMPSLVGALRRCHKSSRDYDILYVTLAAAALARVDASHLYLIVLSELPWCSAKAMLVCDDGVLPTFQNQTGHSTVTRPLKLWECPHLSCACFCTCDRCWHSVCEQHLEERLKECHAGKPIAWNRSESSRKSLLYRLQYSYGIAPL